MDSPPTNECDLLERHERLWCRAQEFADEVTWLPDREAAQRWADRIRSGEGDEEDWKLWLEHVAYLDPHPADACLEWLQRERLNGGNDERHDRAGALRVDRACLDDLRQRADRGRRARQLAVGPAEERRRHEESLRDPAERPNRRADERSLILAEALVDPTRAAWLVGELWNTGYSDPRSECEVARRLWLHDPDAALNFIDRRKHYVTLLPTLLRRVLAEPMPQNRRLAVEIICRFSRLSPLIGRLALIHSLPTLVSWPEVDRVDLGQAMVQAFVDLDSSGGYLFNQLRDRFTEAARCHLATAAVHP